MGACRSTPRPPPPSPIIITKHQCFLFSTGDHVTVICNRDQFMIELHNDLNNIILNASNYVNKLKFIDQLLNNRFPSLYPHTRKIASLITDNTDKEHKILMRENDLLIMHKNDAFKVLLCVADDLPTASYEIAQATAGCTRFNTFNLPTKTTNKSVM